MKEHSLKLTEDGRVTSSEVMNWQDRKPERTFQFAIAGEELKVEYTREYFPGSDLFSFLSPHDPPQAHCLSASGYWCPFIPSDVVDALGGAEAFAGIYADAKLQGTEKELLAVFEGKRPEARPRRKAPQPPASEQVVGEHTARVVEPEAPGKGTVQGRLF